MSTTTTNEATGHAPGPWRVGIFPAENNIGHDTFVMPEGLPNDWIARIAPHGKCAENAKLIASAPDLAAENLRLREDLGTADRLHAVCEEAYRKEWLAQIESARAEIATLRAERVEMLAALSGLRVSVDGITPTIRRWCRESRRRDAIQCADAILAKAGKGAA